MVSELTAAESLAIGPSAGSSLSAFFSQHPGSSQLDTGKMHSLRPCPPGMQDPDEEDEARLEKKRANEAEKARKKKEEKLRTAHEREEKERGDLKTAGRMRFFYSILFYLIRVSYFFSNIAFSCCSLVLI